MLSERKMSQSKYVGILTSACSRRNTLSWQNPNTGAIQFEYNTTTTTTHFTCLLRVKGVGGIKLKDVRSTLLWLSVIQYMYICCFYMNSLDFHDARYCTHINWLGSIQLTMASMHSEKWIGAPLHVSKHFPALPLKQNQCLIDNGPFLSFRGSSASTSSFYALSSR